MADAQTTGAGAAIAWQNLTPATVSWQNGSGSTVTWMSTGTITVTFEPPLRDDYAYGTAVTWDHPVGYYKTTNQETKSTYPGGQAGQGGFALDLIEQFD